MPIAGDIFNKPKKDKTNDDFVGRFRSGYQANNRPVSLDQWRMTFEDTNVGDRLVELFGGAADGVTSWETKGDDALQVFTEAASVPIVLDGAGSVRTSLVLWSNKGGKVLETDGQYLIEEGKVTNKPDPDASLPLSERKEKAKNGTGPEPSIQVYFRLADDEGLGKFRFFSGAWSALPNFSEAEEALKDADGPVNAFLSLERVEWESNGQKRSFVKPVIELEEL